MSDGFLGRRDRCGSGEVVAGGDGGGGGGGFGFRLLVVWRGATAILLLFLLLGLFLQSFVVRRLERCSAFHALESRRKVIFAVLWNGSNESFALKIKRKQTKGPTLLG